MSAFDHHTHTRVRLLELEPAFADAIPHDDLAAARRLITADAWGLAPGPWTPSLACRNGRHGFALLVVNGLLLREVSLTGRRATQVYGPGDILRPSTSEESSLSEDVRWTVMTGGAIAVLDELFAAAARKWPRLHTVVQDRLFAQIERGAVQLAISHLPRIEQRLLAMLWHLADSFGHVTTGGIAVPFALTHETLGRLVGARRPTVSLGLTALQEAGGLRRRPEGGWLLDPGSRALLDDAGIVTGRRRLARPTLRVVAEAS